MPRSLVARTFALTVLAAGLAAALPAQALDYQFIEIGASAQNTRATALNDLGQVVGYTYDRPNSPWGLLGADLANSQAFVTGANGQGISLLGTLNNQAGSQANDINNAGQVAGISGDAVGSRAFIASGGQLRDLGTLGGANSGALGLNASGQVVGWAENAAGQRRAVITDANGGALRDLNAPFSGYETRGNAINASGQVVGESSSGQNRASFSTGPNGTPLAVYSPSAYANPNHTTIPVAVAINDNGQIASHGSYAWDNNPVVLQNADGATTQLSFANTPFYELGNLGAFGQYGPISQAYVETLNNLGQIGGYISNARQTQAHAFITGANGTVVQDVNNLNFVNPETRDFWFQTVTDINNNGQFIAIGSNGNSYLISAVPEPASVAMMLAGLGLVGTAARRRSGPKALASSGKG